MKRQPNKTNIIVFAVVVFLVLLFGVGQFLAFSNSNLSPSQALQNQSSTESKVAPVTNIVRYVPPAPASSTPKVAGSCWTSSLAAPFRPDAWRCAVGNGIQDPCFQIGTSTSKLLCGMNPANPDATSSFVLLLTKPLPAPERLPIAPPNDWAWLVELQDGTVCSPFTGTLPFAAGGETGSYGCAPRYSGDDRMIFDDLNVTTTGQWTAMVGTLSASTSTFPPPIIASSTVSIMTVWQ